MRPFRIDRRTLLRGSGSVAIALPFLEAMQPVGAAMAQVPTAERFVAVYHPGGTTLDQFRPTGTEQSFTLSPILEPLAPVQQYLTLFQGLDMKCRSGEQDQAGMVAWLTGSMQDMGTPGPSIDLPLLERLGGDLLYLALRWNTTPDTAGAPHFSNSVSYRVAAGQYVPQAPAIDPAATWQKLFGQLTPDQGQLGLQKSILDGVLGRFAKLSQRVGKRDRELLDAHMQSLRELEQRVDAICRPPELLDTTGYDPEAFAALAPSTDAALPVVGKLMMDMLVMALSCDLNRVAILQWADSHAAYTLPWLDLPGNELQRFYESDGGYHPEQMTQIFTWYSSQHSYLLQRMAEVEAEPGRSLLDGSVVFFGSHLQHPATHSVDDMPFVLAGHGGGLAGNRYRQYTRRSHSDLLVSILNLFGDPAETFGDPTYNSGALDLTS